MPTPADSSPETILTLIRGAAEGRPEDRSRFCGRYLPVVRTYLAARWRQTPWADQVDDGVQDVFLECLKERGALETYETGRPGGFRAFLYAVVRNVALRLERAGGRRAARERAVGSQELRALEQPDASLSRLFDREWARAVMQQAREVLEARAALAGEAALRRVAILDLRFAEGLPVRDIAARFGEDPAAVHRAYRKAREEFRESLEEAVAYHFPGTRAEVAAECTRLLELLQG